MQIDGALNATGAISDIESPPWMTLTAVGLCSFFGSATIPAPARHPPPNTHSLLSPMQFVCLFTGGLRRRCGVPRCCGLD